MAVEKRDELVVKKGSELSRGRRRLGVVVMEIVGHHVMTPVCADIRIITFTIVHHALEHIMHLYTHRAQHTREELYP